MGFTESVTQASSGVGALENSPGTPWKDFRWGASLHCPGHLERIVRGVDVLAGRLCVDVGVVGGFQLRDTVLLGTF